MLACRSTVLVFVHISLMSHAWHYFCKDSHRCGDSLHTHACFPIFRILHLMFHVRSSTLVCTHLIMHSYFSCFQSPVSQLGLPWHKICLTWLALRISEAKALPSLQKLWKYGLAPTSRLALRNSWRQCLVGPQKLCNIVCWLQGTADSNCALRSFNNQ